MICCWQIVHIVREIALSSESTAIISCRLSAIKDHLSLIAGDWEKWKNTDEELCSTTRDLSDNMTAVSEVAEKW